MATIAIEIFARELGVWSYAREMPVVVGVGVMPLLQWLVVPALTLLLVRTASDRTDEREDREDRT